jgi:hypothetical protein
MRGSLVVSTTFSCLAAIALAAFWMEVLDPGMSFLLISAFVFLVGGVLVATFLSHALFAKAAGRSSTGLDGEIHRGINAAHIPIAGFPGIVFVAGFVFMFWSGFPPLRPLVVALAIVGGIAGAVLVLMERRHRVATDTPLGLSTHAAGRPDAADGASRRPRW